MRKISLDSLDVLFKSLSETAKLYIPRDTDAGAYFLPWREGDALSARLNTARSAKDFFFPQTETLMEFTVNGKKIELRDVRREEEDFILFGVRACDARAFTVLDNVFTSAPADSYYMNRRAHGLIISLACNKPAETCFCRTFGIDASAPEGDISCVMTDDALYLDAKTEKGKALLSRLEAVTEPAEPTDAEERRTLIRRRLDALPLASLSATAFGGDKTKTYFDDPAWSSLSEACLGCGTCTFVCPTCQCYDIRDFKTKDGVRRFRCWDSCMYSDFTKMSAGQPRLTQKERFRQRFMHKLVYYPANNDGLFACVGCGRCVNACPIKMNIVKVMKTLGKGGEHDD